MALTYDNMCNVLEGKSIDDESLQKLIENGSFSKIYGYLIKKLDSQDKELLDSNDGIWVKYDRGSKPDKLVNSLQGKGTGWCTAGYETAKKQLQDGDFHIYYTKDKEGNYSQPRIAIRMEGSKIGEIRGIAEKQNLESEMEKILSEKLKEFPDKDEYLKKVHDMEVLTKLYKEHKDRALTKEELRFLYEIDTKIVGFGYQEDPRIKEILDDRDFKEDLSLVFGCSEDQVSNDVVDSYYKSIVCFYGDFSFEGALDGRFFKFPQIVVGNLKLSKVKIARDIVFPEIVTGGYINLRSLQWAENVKFTQNICGSLSLDSLEFANNVILPQSCDTLYMYRMESLDGLVVPADFNYDWVSANYITKEDLMKKSLENNLSVDGHKQKGFSNVYILALFTYITSLILTLIGFLILK